MNYIMQLMERTERIRETQRALLTAIGGVIIYISLATGTLELLRPGLASDSRLLIGLIGGAGAIAVILIVYVKVLSRNGIILLPVKIAPTEDGDLTAQDIEQDPLDLDDRLPQGTLQRAKPRT